MDDLALTQLFAQQSAMLDRMDAHLARQDEILAKMDERLARQDQILAAIQESTERTAQYHVRTDQLLAQTTLVLDRLMERLERRP